MELGASGGSVHVVLELIEVGAVLVDLLPQLGEPVDSVSELSLAVKMCHLLLNFLLTDVKGLLGSLTLGESITAVVSH